MIKGWNKTSLIDFSPNVASVIFLGGCNFKCPYCHNPELVLNFNSLPEIKEEEIIDYLSDKKKWVDGVVITGGEPTIHPKLPLLISKINKLGFLVKLDTNGTNPLVIKDLIDKKLIDYVAMDIKANLEKYDEAAGVEVDKDKIQQSVDILKNSSIDVEFRTTVVPGLVGKKEIFFIAKWLKGSKNFVIQNFRNTGAMIDNKLKEMKPFSKKELDEMKEIASEYFEKVVVKS